MKNISGIVESEVKENFSLISTYVNLRSLEGFEVLWRDYPAYNIIISRALKAKIKPLSLAFE